MASGIILLDPSALLCNKSFLLLAQVGDAIPYFRPPLEPTGIDARDIILSASPTDLTVDLDARQRRRPQPAIPLVFCVLERP
jgi:hypothetical protein